MIQPVAVATITHLNHISPLPVTHYINVCAVIISLQFWAAYAPCEAQFKDAVQITLEQIDVIKRLTERYTPQLTLCTSAVGKYDWCDSVAIRRLATRPRHQTKLEK